MLTPKSVSNISLNLRYKKQKESIFQNVEENTYFRMLKRIHDLVLLHRHFGPSSCDGCKVCFIDVLQE